MDYGAVRDAVVRHAREEAALPSFPELVTSTSNSWMFVNPDAPIAGSVLKVMAVDKVQGQVLPRGHDTWMALLPFEDIQKKDPEDVKLDKMRKRRQFVELLVRLAASPDFQWDASMDCGASSVHDNPEISSSSSKSTFWIDLMRALCPSARFDQVKELERNLIVLSREPQPRFLLCVPTDPSRIDVAELLDDFLRCSETRGDVYRTFLQGCGLKSRNPDPQTTTFNRTVEVGLSFTQGTITHRFLTDLLWVMKRQQSTPNGDNSSVHFRVTTLRFGRECVIQSKATEVLEKVHQFNPYLTCIHLGNLANVKPASLRCCLLGANDARAKVERLAVISPNRFPATASLLRASKTSTLRVLSVPFEATTEFAAWLAFALFHVDSSSSLTSLSLQPSTPDDYVDTASLTTDWIESFKRTLQSPTGRQDLAGLESDTQDDGNDGSEAHGQSRGCVRSFVSLPAGTTIKEEPSSGAKLLCRVSSDDDEYEVIGYYNSFVSIVVPGAGVGWALSTAISSKRSIPSSLATTTTTATTDGADSGSSPLQTNGRITSFTWVRACPPCYAATATMGAEQHAASLLELLAIIGGPLERLALPNMILSEAHFASILRLCPNLLDLNIAGSNYINDIAPLVSRYESGQCRITTLSMGRARGFQEPGEIGRQMTQLLQHHPTVLHRVAMDLLPPRPHTDAFRSFYQDVVVPLISALEQSPTIDFAQWSNCSILEDEDEGGQRLPVVEPRRYVGCNRAMPLRAKLALLSVVATASDADGLSHFDSQILSVIFGFCRQAVAKHVIKDISFELMNCDCNTCVYVLHSRW